MKPYAKIDPTKEPIFTKKTPDWSEMVKDNVGWPEINRVDHI